MPGGTAERVVLVATFVVLLAIGALASGIEAFLVPLRLTHGIEGLAAVLALFGNILICSGGGIGTRMPAGAIVPFVSWFVMTGVLMFGGPGGDVVLPGTLPVDPGVTKVTVAFLLAGIFGGGIGILLTMIYTGRANRPTSPV